MRESPPDPFGSFIEALFRNLSIDWSVDLARETNLFEEVGLDSVQTYEMLVVIDELAGSSSSLDDLPDIYTLGDAFDYYVSLGQPET